MRQYGSGARKGSSVVAYEDKFWSSHDELRLHYRDYAGREDRPAVLCIPGLSRNARDFEDLADRLANEGWRVLCVELRGRGESGYAKDPMTYVPLVYLQDLMALIDALAVPRFVGIGTSLGGIMLMLLATVRRERLAGVLLNDIGPELAPAGLERIRTYVGTGGPQPTWVHAARQLSAINRVIYPDWRLQDWLRFAKRLCKVNSQGRIVFDYDQRISEPFRASEADANANLWPAYGALAGMPLALVRGALSDLLSPETTARMKEAMPDLDVTEVPRVGHAPTLDEPEAVAAVDRLLARVLAAS